MEELIKQGQKAEKLSAALQNNITKSRRDNNSDYRIGFKPQVVNAMPNLSESRVRRAVQKLKEQGYEFEKTKEGYTVSDLIAIYEERGELLDFKILTNGKCYSLFINSLKGGVSKTVSVVTLAHALKANPALIRMNLKILVLDLDPQASATMFLDYLHSLGSNRTAIQAMLNDDLTPQELKDNYVIKTPVDGVDIIPASVDDGFIASDLAALAKKNSKHKEYELLQKNVIDKLSDSYDLILTDVGPHLDHILRNAFVSADMLATPIPPAMVDLHSTLKYIAHIPSIVGNLKDQGYPIKFKKNIGYMTKMRNVAEHRNSHAYAKKVFVDSMLDENLPHSNCFERVGESFSSIISMDPEEYNGDKKTLRDIREKSFTWAASIFDRIERDMVGDNSHMYI